MKRALDRSTLLLLMTLTLVACAAAQQSGRTTGMAASHDLAAQTFSRPTLDLNTIVGNVAAAQVANHSRPRAYTVTREYQLSKRGADDISKVTVDVSFVPPGTKEYEIRSASGGHGEKVVRKVLEHEAELAGEWQQTAITQDNYEFEYVGLDSIDGRSCYVLKLTPKRESRDLIKGQAFIDGATFQIRRIVGEPAKNPSWWIRKVNLVLNFGPVRGSWIQVATQADADVRLFGRHTLVSRDVDFRSTEVVAQAERPNLPRTKQSPRGQAQLESRSGASQTGIHTASHNREHRSSYSVIGTGVVLSPR